MLDFTSIALVGSSTWKWTWAATTGPYKVFRDGEVYADDLDDTFITIHGDDSEEPPAIEVHDADDADADASNIKYSPLAILQWRGNPDYYYYRVEQYVDAAWSVVRVVPEELRGYYHYKTEPLTDGTEAQFRVIAVDSRGYESTPLPYTFVPVRNPAPPSITVTYDQANTELDITERS